MCVAESLFVQTNYCDAVCDWFLVLLRNNSVLLRQCKFTAGPPIRGSQIKLNVQIESVLLGTLRKGSMKEQGLFLQCCSERKRNPLY